MSTTKTVRRTGTRGGRQQVHTARRMAQARAAAAPAMFYTSHTCRICGEDTTVHVRTATGRPGARVVSVEADSNMCRCPDQVVPASRWQRAAVKGFNVGRPR